MADEINPGTGETAQPATPGELRIARIVDDFISQLQSGRPSDRRRLEQEHPDLAPELGARLAVAERVFRAATRQKPIETGPEAESARDEMSVEATSSLRESSLLSDIQAERARRLRCPHCGNPIQLVDTNPAEITCRVCGSSFHYDSNATATYVPSKHPKSIGRFEVQEMLGRGAFGIVYKAYDSELRRTVAIKVPRAGQFVHAEEKERFLREARSVARLRHAQIVQVHEVLHENGVPCIVSDFVDGLTLDDIASGRRVSFREAADFVARAADALDYAHDAGVIHRDVKPSNILIDHGGRLFLTDFGLARQDDGEITMTVDGEVIGTPAYMSPEQAAGRLADIDRRSDVYSLGVVLYRLLSGELPFRGSKRMTIYQVIHEEPKSLHTLNEHIPRDLETIALKAMSKELVKRYASARELADDLRRWLRGEPIHARPVGRVERLWRWSRKHRLVAGLTATIVVLLVMSAAAGAVWAVRERGLRRTADIAKEHESRERQRANDNAVTSQQRLSRLRRTQGAQLLNESDLFGALTWYTSAMGLDQGGRANDAIDRLRLGTILAQCPKLSQLWTHSERVSVVDVSADGRLVLSGGTDGVVEIWSATTGQRVTSLRHGGPVRTAAFSPDGERVVSSSTDKSVILWTVANPVGKKQALPHTQEVRAVAFSPDGQFVATGCHDKRVRLWNVETGTKSAETEDHDGGVNGVEFHPDGNLILATTPDFFGVPGSVRFWKLPDLSAQGEPITSTHTIRHAMFSPDGDRVLICSDDRTARVWNVATGEAVSPPLPHLDVVVDGRFTPDGKHVVTASVDASVRIWDAATGHSIGSAIRHAADLRLVTLSRDGRFVAVGGGDGVVRVCELRNQDLIAPVLSHDGPVTGLKFDSTNHRLVTSGSDGTVKLWDLPADSIAFPRLHHKADVTRVAFAPDGRHVLTTSGGQPARWWDVETGNVTDLTEAGEMRTVGFSPAGERFAMGGQDGAVRIGDARTGDLLPLKMNHEAMIFDLAFDPTGNRLATVGQSRQAKVWDVSTGALLASLEHKDFVRHARFSPDGKLLATTSNDLLTRLWRTDNWQKAREPFEHKYSAFGGEFSPDGRKLLTQTDKAALLWDLETGRHVRLDHGDFVYSAKFSPSGQWIATSGWDDSAAIWDAETGRRILPLMKHGNADVFETVIGRDGHLLATGSAGRRPFALPSLGGIGAAQVWDANTADPVSPPLRHGERVARLALSADGRRLVSADRNGTAIAWRLEPDNRPLDDLRTLAELLAGRRIDDMSGLVPLSADELKSRWEQLRPKYPESFTSSAAAVAAWERGEN